MSCCGCIDNPRCGVAPFGESRSIRLTPTIRDLKASQSIFEITVTSSVHVFLQTATAVQHPLAHTTQATYVVPTRFSIGKTYGKRYVAAAKHGSEHGSRHGIVVAIARNWNGRAGRRFDGSVGAGY